MTDMYNNLNTRNNGQGGWGSHYRRDGQTPSYNRSAEAHTAGDAGAGTPGVDPSLRGLPGDMRSAVYGKPNGHPNNEPEGITPNANDSTANSHGAARNANSQRSQAQTKRNRFGAKQAVATKKNAARNTKGKGAADAAVKKMLNKAAKKGAAAAVKACLASTVCPIVILAVSALAGIGLMFAFFLLPGLQQDMAGSSNPAPIENDCANRIRHCRRTQRVPIAAQTDELHTCQITTCSQPVLSEGRSTVVQKQIQRLPEYSGSNSVYCSPDPCTINHSSGTHTIKLVTIHEDMHVRQELVWHFTNFINAMASRKDDIYPYGYILVSTSSFRTRAKQQELLDKYGPNQAADPGTSQHEIGEAVDLSLCKPNLTTARCAENRWEDATSVQTHNPALLAVYDLAPDYGLMVGHSGAGVTHVSWNHHAYDNNFNKRTYGSVGA